MAKGIARLLRDRAKISHVWAKEWDQPRADHPQRVFVVYEPVENQSYQPSPDVSLIPCKVQASKETNLGKRRRRTRFHLRIEKQPSSGADDSSEPGQENSPTLPGRFVRDASCTRFAFEDNRLCKLYIHAGVHSLGYCNSSGRRI